MSLWTGFTKILGQGLAIIGGAIGVNVDGTTITINGSNQLVSSGGGGVPVTGPFEYVNTRPLTDTSNSLYYGNGHLLADANGDLYYPDDSLMADINGNLHYGNGNLLADSAGYVYYGNGGILGDILGNLYYADASLLADATGSLYYGNGNLLADANGDLYFSNGTQLAAGSGRLNATVIDFSTTQVTTNGSTSGSTVSSMPFQGGTYKKAIIYINALVNATSTSYTFPTAFTNIPAITYAPSGDAALITLSTTAVTFAVGSFASGFVTIEGY
jgi:hypothetical protein